MKKLILISALLLTLIVTTACPFPEPYLQFDTISEAASWIRDNIEYRSSGTFWKSPARTYSDMTGDCLDQAVLLMYFAKLIGFNSELHIFYMSNDTYHAAVYVQVFNCYFDTTMTHHPITFYTNLWGDPVFKYSYNKTMQKVTDY